MQKKKAQHQGKTFRQDKPVHAYTAWVFKTTKSQIYQCECGGKYLKTRRNQTMCLACMRMGR